jgi:cobalt-zinc-cadmium efflux system membrane fusion protein
MNMSLFNKFLIDLFALLRWSIGALKALVLELMRHLRSKSNVKELTTKFKTIESQFIHVVEVNLSSTPQYFWQTHHRKIIRIGYLMIVFFLALNMARCFYKPSLISVEPYVESETISFPGVKKPLNGIKSSSLDSGASQVLSLPGRLVWDENKTSKVASPFAGRVDSVNVQLGQKVENGEVLAIIHSSEFGQAQADAKKSEALATLARSTLTRSKELFDHGVLSKREFDQITADSSQAFAEFDRAASRVKALGGQYKTIDQKFALKTSVSGMVVERNIYPGREISSDVSAGSIFTVTDPKNLWAILEASETDLGKFSEGSEVYLSSSTLPNEKLSGKITHISDFIDPLTRTVKVRVSIPNEGMKLKAEMFVQANITLAKVEGIVVPTKAIILMGEKNYVFIETDVNQFTRKEIKIGAQFADRSEVLEGVKDEDKIVIEGALYLNEILRSDIKVNATKSSWPDRFKNYFNQFSFQQ